MSEIRSKRIRQADIAAAAGVSVSTVSRVLTNEPGISEAIRQHIFKVASDLGYPLKTAAEAEAGGLALIASDSVTGGLSVFYEGILEGLRAGAAERGMRFDIRLIREARTEPDLVKEYMQAAGAEGLFLVGIASYSYTNFRRSKSTAFQSGSFQTESIPGMGAASEFPEFSQFKIPIPKHLLDSSRNASKAQDSSHSGITAERDASNSEDRSRSDLDVGSGIIFTVIDLLQRIGHWGVARKYAATLSALAKNKGDEDWMLI